MPEDTQTPTTQDPTDELAKELGLDAEVEAERGQPQGGSKQDAGDTADGAGDTKGETGGEAKGGKEAEAEPDDAKPGGKQSEWDVERQRLQQDRAALRAEMDELRREREELKREREARTGQQQKPDDEDEFSKLEDDHYVQGDTVKKLAAQNRELRKQLTEMRQSVDELRTQTAQVTTQTAQQQGAARIRQHIAQTYEGDHDRIFSEANSAVEARIQQETGGDTEKFRAMYGTAGLSLLLEREIAAAAGRVGAKPKGSSESKGGKAGESQADAKRAKANATRDPEGTQLSHGSGGGEVHHEKPAQSADEVIERAAARGDKVIIGGREYDL